jgi:hypothetical protein
MKRLRANSKKFKKLSPVLARDVAFENAATGCGSIVGLIVEEATPPTLLVT